VFVGTRRVAAGLGLGALLLAGAGCAAGDKPRTLPPLTATPTPVASSTPVSDDKAQLAAAEAVVRRYYALLNAPTTEANASALAALMTSTCKCLDVVRATRAAARARHHFFGHLSLVSVVPHLDGLADADVLVTYDFSRSGIADAQGRELHADPPTSGASVNLQLRRVQGEWRIAQILNLSAGSHV
jgi:hypothetical protein